MNAVATTDEATTVGVTVEDGRLIEWTRSDEQAQLVSDHLALVQQMYAAAGLPADLVQALSDQAIYGTPELAAFFGYKRRTRVFQRYTEARDLQAADQVPHPSALPEADATGGHRGAREIRGEMAGRVRQWALQAGLHYWDPRLGREIRQESINHGGAPKQS